MSPWDLIGWAIVGLVGLTAAQFFLRVLRIVVQGEVKQVRRFRAYRRTRNAPIEKGQIWWGDGFKTYKIVHVWTRDELLEKWEGMLTRNLRPPATFRLAIQSGGASWREDIEDFRERIRRQRLYLAR